MMVMEKKVQADGFMQISTMINTFFYFFGLAIG